MAQNRSKRAPGRMVAVLRVTAEAGSQWFQTALRRAPDSSGEKGLNRFTMAQNWSKRAPGRMVAILRMTAEAGSQWFQTALRRA